LPRRIVFPALVFLFGLRFILGAETIKLFSFNMQIFGVSKAAKSEVMMILADIVSRSDVTAVQEVRSADIEPVMRFMRMLPPAYAFLLGPREGRSASKEQHWIIYDSSKLRLLDERTWPDPQDIFERSPLGAYFQTRGAFDFILINNHLQPSNAARELAALPDVVRSFQELWGETDVALVGDFNADGAYYDENDLAALFPEDGYRIIISNDYDTTLASSDNTYDRIIITASAFEDYAGASGVLRFDELYDFSELSIEPRHVSDHYPVWAEFYTAADTD
jgi:endonuclease/exonuclease/phosphatase family metal-dependent hydrolase